MFLLLGWNGREGGDDTNSVSVDGVLLSVQWYAISLQKSSGADVVRAYLNGLLIVTEPIGSPLSTIDQVRLRAVEGAPIIREFSARSSAVLPEIPFSPTSGVRFDIGDPALRWNSYML